MHFDVIAEFGFPQRKLDFKRQIFILKNNTNLVIK